MSRRASLLVLTASALAVAGPLAVPTSTPALAGSPGPASVSESWGPVKRLAPNPNGEALAVDARGVVTVVWANRHAPQGVVVQRRSPAGVWGPRKVVGHGLYPQVATDRRGDVTVAWITTRPGHASGVAVATHRYGGHWTEPVPLTRPVRIHAGQGSFGVAQLSLAVNARGATVVAWDWGSDGRHHPWQIRSAYRPAHGTFGPAVAVTAADGSSWPQVGIGGRGNVTLLCQRWHPAGTLGLYSARRVVGGGWTAATRVVHEGFGAQLAVDRAGRAVVVYSPNFNRVWTVRRPAHGPWSQPRALSAQGVRIESYALATNARGTAMVAMARGAGPIVVVRRAPTGSWSDPVTVATGPAPFPMLALNGAGDAFVGWGEYALMGVYRARGASWGDPMVISPDAGVEVLESTHAVVSPHGDVTVLWKQEDLPLKVRTMTVLSNG